jgi:hypothetical protein
VMTVDGLLLPVTMVGLEALVEAPASPVRAPTVALASPERARTVDRASPERVPTVDGAEALGSPERVALASQERAPTADGAEALASPERVALASQERAPTGALASQERDLLQDMTPGPVETPGLAMTTVGSKVPTLNGLVTTAPAMTGVEPLEAPVRVLVSRARAPMVDQASRARDLMVDLESRARDLMVDLESRARDLTVATLGAAIPPLASRARDPMDRVEALASPARDLTLMMAESHGLLLRGTTGLVLS